MNKYLGNEFKICVTELTRLFEYSSSENELHEWVCFILSFSSSFLKGTWTVGIELNMNGTWMVKLDIFKPF